MVDSSEGLIHLCKFYIYMTGHQNPRLMEIRVFEIAELKIRKKLRYMFHFASEIIASSSVRINGKQETVGCSS